mmetsp:Transcript_31528/g.86837  ORF Transcript_31528/g.86837 Transcript_31528/m.86837 type:complete len:232 (-) Transcript_31528:331-1026(-)
MCAQRVWTRNSTCHKCRAWWASTTSPVHRSSPALRALCSQERKRAAATRARQRLVAATPQCMAELRCSDLADATAASMRATSSSRLASISCITTHSGTYVPWGCRPWRRWCEIRPNAVTMQTSQRVASADSSSRKQISSRLPPTTTTSRRHPPCSRPPPLVAFASTTEERHTAAVTRRSERELVKMRKPCTSAAHSHRHHATSDGKGLHGTRRNTSPSMASDAEACASTSP